MYHKSGKFHYRNLLSTKILMQLIFVASIINKFFDKVTKLNYKLIFLYVQIILATRHKKLPAKFS